MRWNNIRRALLDILYPVRCPVCDGVLPFGERYVHKACEDKLKKIGSLYCMKCGRPVLSDEEVFCRFCAIQRHEFDLGVSAYIYNDAMKNAIYRFKYGNRREYAGYFGRELAKAICKRKDILQADLIVPVPLYAGKLKKRGFNQAELLSAEVSRLLRIPMDARLVERIRSTRAQKELGAFERRKNLKKAFKIGQNDVKLKKILVVDDIFTTGSTMDEIAGVLKQAGVASIYAATLATGAPK